MAERTNRLAGAVRNFFALGIGNYGAMAFGLAVNVLLARRLGTDGYGRLALMLMGSQALLLMTVNWSYTGFIRFAAQEFASNQTVSGTLWTRLAIIFPVATLAVVVAVIARDPLAAYLDVPPVGLWLVVLHFAAASALSMIGAVFQATGQMARYGVCLLLDKVLMLLCLVALPAPWTSDPIVVLACYAASALSVTVWGVSAMGWTALRPVLPTRSAYRHLALFSVPALLTSWTGLLGASWFDLVILRWYVPMSGIGVYSLATQLTGVVQQITIIFSTLVLPPLSVMVAEKQDARIRLLMERLLPYWLLGTSILFSLVLFAVRVGVPLVFGESFGAAAPIVALLMIATSALALFNSCAPLVAARGSMWVLSGIYFASAAANVVLDLILIPSFGVVGSALATVIAYSTSAVLVLTYVQQKVGSRVVRLGWLTVPVLITSICFMTLDGVWFYVVAPIAAAITVVILVVAFRLFHSDDAVFLKDLRLPTPFGLGAG